MKKYFQAAALAAVITIPQLSHAAIISTIDGFYDTDSYDTPSLFIQNTSAFDFTNVQLTVTAYQGDNNGLSATVSLPTISAGDNLSLIWGANCDEATGSCASANTTVINTNNLAISGDSTLLANDYDDSDGGHACLPSQTVNASLCGDPGNFYVTFTATWNGESIYSQFSPDNTLPGAGNAAGMFVGWEGLDPDGLSETSYDSHSNGGPNGVLANIVEGTPPPAGTPEPASIVLLGSALVSLGFLRRKRA